MHKPQNKLYKRPITLGFSMAIALSLAGYAAGLPQKSHVLLISIDGMHAVDFLVCASSGNCPNLASLTGTSKFYAHTSTSKPSDSFPGLMALVTGGKPKYVGAFYDVAWDRVLAPPAKTTGNGLAAGPCTPGKNNGTQTEYEEGDEINQLLLNGGGPYASPIDGGVLSIDSTRLIRDPFSTPVACAPVYPWNFIRTNTIYGVIHAAGGYTAWSDKHAVYAAVSGPTGTANASNVDDYYSPEVNSNQIPLPGVTTAGTNFNCGTIQASGSATVPGNDWTTDFQAIQCYDQLKVNAVLNWIKGKTHLGTSAAPVPVIFGMNFQAVSVGQKLIENGVKGGYTGPTAQPTPQLANEFKFVDAAVGQMITALKSQNLLESTVIIVTAKHGQSPIDPNRYSPIPGAAPLNNGTSPANLLVAAGLVPAAEVKGPGPTEDDISLLWLSPGNTSPAINFGASDPAITAAAVTLLENNAKTAGIGEIFVGPAINMMFSFPGVPSENTPCCALQPNLYGLFGGDPRAPDIIVQPYTGVTYTANASKQMEHGGFSFDDTDVILLVSNPDIKSDIVYTSVETMQVAPTILQILGMNPAALLAVQYELTAVLPGLFQ